MLREVWQCVRTTQATHKYMPYWCSDCRSYFSIRTGDQTDLLYQS